MAKSGSFNSTGLSADDGSIYLQFSWSIKSQSIEDNETTISWELKGAGTSKQWFQTGNVKLTIEGINVYSSTGSFKLKSGTVVASGTRTFTHNNDGTRDFSASVVGGIFYYTSENAKGSGTWEIDTIARASQPSLVTYPNTTNDVGDFGEEFSIHMNTASQSFTHTVRYEYGDRSGTIATGVVNGTTWAVPLSFMNDIPNATSASGRIFVDTYSGSTLVGTKYTGFTVTVPASVKPSCTVTLTDTTGMDGIYGSPVQGLSKIKVSVTATEAYSSPIASYDISINGTKYSTATATTGFLVNSGDSPVKVTVTDKRGRTSAVWSYTMNVQAYSPPSISMLSVGRCDEDGTDNDQGNFVEVRFSASVTPLGNLNTVSYRMRYKKTSDTTWSNVALASSGYLIEEDSHIFEADPEYSYDIELIVTDRHKTATRSTSVSTAFTLMDWHNSGTGIRFGGVAEEKNTLQNDLWLRQTANRYAFSSGGTSGTAGYIRMARIELTSTNADSVMTFVLTRRRAETPMTVHIRFQDAASVDPELGSIVYEGTNYGAFLVKTSTSTWDLFVQKSPATDTITLQDWYTSYRQMKRINVTFPGDQVSTVPSPYYRATPAVLTSIIDCLLPVGMIIQLYSHADPNDMYPGTTWVRLTNTFLWGCDASGDIGITGGEKTHKLTTDEIPSHTHGAVYSADAGGAKNLPWLSTSVLGTGDKLAYSTVATGGSTAHNNMPPYTQVSIWRRTA